MANRLFGRPRVSLESLRDEPAVVEEDVIEIATRPDPEAIEAEAAVVDATDDVIAADSDVGELTDAADTLETYRQVLEGSLEENGMDRAGAAAVQVGLDATLSRIGSEISTPAMESYGSASNRIQATRLTIEAISDKLKEIWEAIKRALMSAWEALKKFFGAIFSSVERTRQMAEKIKAAVGSATGTPTEKQVEVKGAGAKLNTNGKIDAKWSGLTIAALGGVGNALTNVDASTDMYSKVAQSLTSGSVTEGSAAAGGAITEYIDTVAAMVGMFKEMGGAAPASSFKVPGVDNNNAKIQLSPILPGNMVLFATSPKSDGPLPLAEAVARAKVGFYQMQFNGQVSDTFPTMDDATIGALADAVLAAMTALDGRKAALEKMASTGEALIKAGDSLIAKAGAESEDAQAAARQTVQALPRLVENSGGWPKQMTSWALSISQAGLKVAQASLKAYRAAASDTPALAAPAAEPATA